MRRRRRCGRRWRWRLREGGRRRAGCPVAAVARSACTASARRWCRKSACWPVSAWRGRARRRHRAASFARGGRSQPAQPAPVHLIADELLAQWSAQGFGLGTARWGERRHGGARPAGAAGRHAPAAWRRGRAELTGLRNPCAQIEAFRPGLLKEVLGRDADGRLVRRAGVMAVVLAGGAVRAGDAIEVMLPALPHRPLERV